MKLQFAGIRRKAEFSPNHVTNDMQIISGTANALRKLGADVSMYDEGDLTPDLIKENLVFSMVQGPTGTRKLTKFAERGALIINSPQSVINCYRVNLVRLLPEGGIPFPKSIIASTEELINTIPTEFNSNKVWVKRGDVHAVHREDVSLAYTNDDKQNTLHEFNRRGIEQAVLQEHLVGDTVKFYAIRETGFFHWYYLNGITHTPFNEERLHSIAEASAEILGLYVFGGDAIVAQDGTVTIIDINDWPSFAPVREAASRHIAQLLFRKGQEHVAQHYNETKALIHCD